MELLKQITQKLGSRKLGAGIAGTLAVGAVPENLTWQTATIVCVYIVMQGLIDMFKSEAGSE